MSEDKAKYIVEYDKTKLYLLAQKLNDLAKELSILTEEDKKLVIERIDKKDPVVLAKFYNALNEYMKW